ncbi:MAG: L-aspartate oxidase [Algicola sp.]|nr:L-aspartate oxidase [Algicola sp.]
MKSSIEHDLDVLIIGSGAAGLSMALKVADKFKVTVLSKGPLKEGSTLYAQGGIAAVFDEKDSIESHIEDTLTAGGGLCEESAVRYTAQSAKTCMKWLINQGVPFDQYQDEQGLTKYHLTREGGHSHRRILHAADATGRAVQTTLINQVLNHPNITLLEKYNAIDLITAKKLGMDENQCIGAYVWNRETEKVEVMRAKFVTLATGGASKVYLYTSNPDVASGDGIAMAWRAGCPVTNMEFNQFPPTSLYHPDAPNFLITEAMRGEGAYLKRADGSRFMPDFDERAELAPRDIVARAIDFEMKRTGSSCVYLDISHKPATFIIDHFPTIHAKCLSVGIDITKEAIPVVPAAHYTCGGIATNFNGQTAIDNLFAIGEVAYTGLHGANRMASNSLLECIVYAHAAGDKILSENERQATTVAIPPWDESRVTDSDEEIVITHNWHELRLFMWDYVGIVRTTKRLERALHRVEMLNREIIDYYQNFKVSNNLLELRNLVTVAELIIRSALSRKESRGLHYTLDYPELDPEAKPTVLKP